ncbi:YeiH family protein [Leisingera methylohalidivorans]|uniref:Membrane protein n=1 Tax=Leisingera methylohalidivorans DSM 14336 TaxID=999552 RepID=V9VPA2_9RHOB|nr:putative sulfate exporter family transporter [Leisingera methylohalidivorans]AHC99528.1 membrane protein [Leisingera methylohalidivorans DSM 14336]
MLARLTLAAFGQPSPLMSNTRALYPGIALAVVIALAALFLSEHYRAPVMLMALMIGMAFNPLAEETSAAAGINFTSKALLRAGVALLGVRVSLSGIASLGIAGFAAIAGLLTGTILLGLLLSRRDWRSGILTGGAVAICGASAALAISACLPKGKALEKETLFTVVAVTALSTLAMIFYPVALVQLGFNEAQTAFVLGASIHDVAQVVGAGLTISEDTAQLATLVKMVRVSLLPLVLCTLVLFGSATGHQGRGGKIPVPGFLVVFIALAVLANTGVIEEAAASVAATVSKWLLIVAISALGAKTSLRSLATVGGAKVMRTGGLTLVLFGASALVARLLPGLS